MSPQQKNIVSTQKPVNIFYVWYSELCRRLNSSPSPVVKPAKPKCQTILDFVADRLKIEDWNPVISALRHDTSLHVISIKSRIGNNSKFLHEIDTEDKARRMRRRYGYIWTAYILNSLLKSLSSSVRNTDVLTCLEFDGIPLFSQYLEPLLKSLKKNNSLKTFSLANCRVNDIGCHSVCDYLKCTPNIEVLNLSGCNLTSKSGEYLAKLIKYQQINRNCESWHNSLRYENPLNHTMRGIKRITLNRNPLFGDNGLDCILNELEDDLWIKALDMQKCGITEKLSKRILNVIQVNQSLEIVDFRLNELLSITTIERILTILKQKYNENHQPEFQWYNTTMSLAYESLVDATSNATIISEQIHHSKSLPNRQISGCKIVECVNNIRKVRTTDIVPKINSVIKYGTINNNLGHKVQKLSSQLQEEIAKRKETERINEELKRKLEEIKSDHLRISVKPEKKNLISAINNSKPKPQNGKILQYKNGFMKKLPNDFVKESSNGFVKEPFNSLVKKLPNGFVKDLSNEFISKLPNGVTTTCLISNNSSFNSADDNNKASTILEEILMSDQKKQNNNESDEEDILTSYLKPKRKIKNKKKTEEKFTDKELSNSQISLYQFVESLKSNRKSTMKLVNGTKRLNNVRT